jgi:hypothetical protein
MTPVEVPAPEPAPVAQRWETLPPPPPEISLPGEAKVATERSAVLSSIADVADSWSGIAPTGGSGLSQRTKILVWATVSMSFAITGMVAYQILDRSAETPTTPTVLAPQGTTPSPRSAAQGADPAKAQTGAPSTAPSDTSGNPMAKPGENPALTNVPAAPTSSAASAPSAMSAPAVNVIRPARSAPRSAPPRSAPTPAVTTPPPVPTPPPAAKPKPKEDLFGI